MSVLEQIINQFLVQKPIFFVHLCNEKGFKINVECQTLHIYILNVLRDRTLNNDFNFFFTKFFFKFLFFGNLPSVL